jgi:pilus assembly protein CpaE
VAAATELSKKVVLVDGSFQFGDVAVLLNLNPKDKSMFELVPELEGGADADVVDTYTVTHSSGLRVILAPPSPEMADVITPAGVKRVIESLRQRYELVVVDCAAWFNDTTLGILDLADIILTVLTLEITSIKNIRLFLEVAEKLGYEDKVRLVLNRADTTLGIRVADVEHSIGRKVDNTIVSDGRAVVYALNRGVPFVISNREAQVSQDVLRLATTMSGTKEAGEDDHKVAQKGKSLFAWR